MKKGVKFLMLFLSVLLLVLISISSAAEEVRRCGTLDKKDAAYYLSGNINLSKNGTCIKISSTNITLDCMNHSISSAGNKTGNGIFSSHPNTTIQNCIIEGFESGYGIYLENSESSIITDNIINGNKQGIVSDSKNVVLAYNSLTLNQNGVIISGKGNLVSNNRICFNKVEDMNCSSNQTFENNHCDSESVCGSQCIPCTHSRYEVSKCMDLNASDSTYILNTDIVIYLQDTCFKIRAENVTLDCNGHKIASALESASKEGYFFVYSDSNYSKIEGCNFEGGYKTSQYLGNAISIDNSHNSIILNNSFRDMGKGIELSGYCSLCEIKENRFNLMQNAINADNLIGGVIEGNKIVSTVWGGIKISSGTSCIVSDNYIEDSQKNSIEFKNDNARVEGNEIVSSSASAIESSGSRGGVIKSNTVKNARLYGIHLIENNGVLVAENNVRSSSAGIFIENSENISISGNNVGTSDFGLKEASSSHLRISGNVFCGNEKDVICESKDNFFNNNCNSRKVCGGRCTTCGRDASLSSLSLWQRIKMFFEGLF